MADSLEAYQSKIAASSNPREITLRALVEINRAHAGYGLLLNWVYACAIDSKCVTKSWIKATNRFFYDRLVENNKKKTTDRRVKLEASIAKKWGEGWHLALYHEAVPELKVLALLAKLCPHEVGCPGLTLEEMVQEVANL